VAVVAPAAAAARYGNGIAKEATRQAVPPRRTDANGMDDARELRELISAPHKPIVTT